ncbi:hypothetical protein BCR36DRAFT_578860 [Piromyces finnis]|uniref:Uncharacterized protein n=1 Tax=Piromyces finnis TaxID=1754191 RepID=A0A1Y1VPI3_9FUNG|nr:hypothetical protein BCR36DRAFT_578860 [Piromyces finnis]|eukprot:ORX60781.1 hypothetical protein BCR36DRAFT_578860 [Piromyces finnis]
MSAPNNGLPYPRDYYDDIVTEGGPETVKINNVPANDNEATNTYQANPNEVVTESGPYEPKK